jgi:(p)ppGpp synthase/HD superfamily hydrolase
VSESDFWKTNLIERAVSFATKAHEGQTRWDKVTPYIEHPKAVAALVYERMMEVGAGTEDILVHMAVAVLHDVVEDCDGYELDDIETEFGPRIRIAVDHLTRREGNYRQGEEDETYVDFVMRSRRNAIARVVKMEDIRHNLTDLQKGSMRDKYQLALMILNGQTRLSELL